jgi:hypothetical protein
MIVHFVHAASMARDDRIVHFVQMTTADFRIMIAAAAPRGQLNRMYDPAGGPARAIDSGGPQSTTLSGCWVIAVAIAGIDPKR